MVTTEVVRTKVEAENQKIFTYEFNDANDIAEQAGKEIEAFLNSLPSTVKVENVEKIKKYQKKDIDIIWHKRNKKTGEISQVTIEIKGDRYHHTGNYFFETLSNKQKGTPGCFLYTEADFIFYYFVRTKELHIIKTKETRNWFLDNETKFKLRKTSTSSTNGLLYTSEGRLVPRKYAQNCVDIHVININTYI